MSKAVITELEALFTANLGPLEQGYKKAQDRAQKFEKKPVEQKIEADPKGALAAMDRVETEAKKIVSAKTVATVDANIEKAETSLSKVRERLDYLHSVEAEMEVTADVKRAEKALQEIERRRDGLVKARESMVVDANTAPAEAALDELADEAAASGEQGGDDAGSNIVGGIVAALATIPIAGAIVGIASTVAGAVVEGFQDGLQQEADRDRLQALTGITEADAERFARAAGEAYADVWGDSIEQNMDTARLALQFDLFDEDATTRQAEGVISSLAGIADVLDEDVRPVASAVSTMIRTGIAANAQEAFDILAAGAREGVNRNEDLLDTFTEYPALFARLGLTGGQSLGLINQGLQAGARNSDLVADALKEFQIRATDASEASADAFQLIGLDAEEMTAKIAKGGDEARDGLDEVLDALRDMEDPVTRNAAAVGLFGTQAEDLGDALFALDLDTAVDQLDGVTGSAQRMFDTLSDSDAVDMEEAKRNVEVAVEGIQGALAEAFSDPLGNAADWISQNRGPMLDFLLQMANGALDFGRSAVIGASNATEAFGGLISGPLADLVDSLAGAIDGSSTLMWFLTGEDASNDASNLQALADDMRNFQGTTSDAADEMRDTLLPGIDDAQERLNDFGIPAVNQGYYHDASLRLAQSIADVGYAADGSQLSLENLDTSNLNASKSGRLLEDQIQASVDALNAEVDAGLTAGETQESLSEKYDQGRQALIDQLEAMDIAHEDAVALADAYGAVPGTVDTLFSALTDHAQQDVDDFVNSNSNRRIVVKVGVASDGSQVYSTDPGNSQVLKFQHEGGLLAPMAAGGSLTPMAPRATRVPPNTWRVIGDRMRDEELYVPMDGSAQSRDLLLYGLRKMGGLPMFDGGVVTPGPASSNGNDRGTADYLIRGIADQIVRSMRAAGGTARLLSENHADQALYGEAVVRR